MKTFLCASQQSVLYALGEYPEAVFVMLFYQVGDLFETIAIGKSRNSITELMDICPEYVNIEKDGEISEIDPR